MANAPKVEGLGRRRSITSGPGKSGSIPVMRRHPEQISVLISKEQF
jgi:hypothetical protein